MTEIERQDEGWINLIVGDGSGNQLLEALAERRGYQREEQEYHFYRDTHLELCDAVRILKGCRKEKWGYFLRAEASICCNAESMQISNIPRRNTMKSRMERVFWHWHKIICVQMAFTF